jgi:hypothetical protein
MTMATEKFRHAIEGFSDTDQHDDKNQRALEVSIRRSPLEKKDEEARESQPFEEFDPCSKGNKAETDAQG